MQLLNILFCYHYFTFSSFMSSVWIVCIGQTSSSPILATATLRLLISHPEKKSSSEFLSVSIFSFSIFSFDSFLIYCVCWNFSPGHAWVHLFHYTPQHIQYGYSKIFHLMFHNWITSWFDFVEYFISCKWVIFYCHHFCVLYYNELRKCG
jgi:hypothetical protein